MKNNNRYLLTLLLLLTGVFLIGKAVFMYYNQHIQSVTSGQLSGILWHGLWLDLRTAALLLIVPTFVCLVKFHYLRWILVPYYVLLGFVIATIIMADMVMYEFWEFKLSAVVLSYAASPEGTTNSVSMGFLASRALGVLAFLLMVAVPAIWMTPRRPEGNRPWIASLVIIVLALLPIRVDSCYHPGPLFQSHAATNPTFRFFHSFGDAERFRTLSCNANNPVYCDSIAAYPATSNEVTDTLLSQKRPCILFVQLESYGSQFVKEMAEGSVIADDVSPNFSRLIPEGIFWEQYYSNSFRTDRGTACTYSGWISYPTVSPMKEASMHSQLSSLPRTLTNFAEYQTGYMYAGAMTNMGKGPYLWNMGFQTLMDYEYFTRDELATGSWGANDSTSAMKLYHTIAEIRPDAQWMLVWQTLSSHEPWDVPYHRLDNKIENAFAYTDQCLGQFVDSLKTLPVWDNLLIIVIPDHGFLYRQTYDNGDFFHSPMLWLGGAIKEPRRISVLMNQSDIAATLLAQMGLPHGSLPWSRNVLAPDYQPFVYCTYPAGLFYKDETGETLFDLSAWKPVPIGEPADSTRLQKALGILRHSYSLISNL